MNFCADIYFCRNAWAGQVVWRAFFNKQKFVENKLGISFKN